MTTHEELPPRMLVQQRRYRHSVECPDCTLPDDVCRFLRASQLHPARLALAPMAVSSEVHFGGALRQRSRFRVDDWRYSTGRSGRCLGDSYHESGMCSFVNRRDCLLTPSPSIALWVWRKQLLSRCVGSVCLYSWFRHWCYRCCDFPSSRKAINLLGHLIFVSLQVSSSASYYERIVWLSGHVR